MDAILYTLAYADVFNYPLTADEIHRYLIGPKTTLCAIKDLLAEKTAKGLIQKTGEHYTLPGRASLVKLRAERDEIATRLWPQAIFYGRLISRLPLVRMVAVTGSLAMNNADETGDIDFLIVTVNQRLWLCRLLVLGVVRLAAWRAIHLCPNYLISERALMLPEPSLYAAHEFLQMIPLSGLEVYQRMRTLNPWLNEYLPNAEGLPARARQLIRADVGSKMTTWLEAFLITPIGGWIERWEMHRKLRKLSRQKADNPEAQFTADICKGHFDRHGQRTKINLDERLQRLALELKP